MRRNGQLRVEICCTPSPFHTTRRRISQCCPRHFGHLSWLWCTLPIALCGWVSHQPAVHSWASLLWSMRPAGFGQLINAASPSPYTHRIYVSMCSLGLKEQEGCINSVASISFLEISYEHATTTRFRMSFVECTMCCFNDKVKTSGNCL